MQRTEFRVDIAANDTAKANDMLRTMAAGIGLSHYSGFIESGFRNRKASILRTLDVEHQRGLVWYVLSG